MQNSASFSQRLIGIGLLSASSIMLEVVLTRLFSAIYFPPYVFFIISFAIFGIGMGAALSALWGRLRQENRVVLYTAGASLSTLVLVIFTVLMAAYDLQVILFALLIIPYMFIGLALSTLFSQHSAASRTLYMGDLLGAGLGALLVIPILNTFGAINGVLLASVGLAVAGFYFYSQRYLIAVIASIALSTVAFGSNIGMDWLRLDMATISTEKPITVALQEGGQILKTSWDAFARTDLVDPGEGGDPLRIYVDGGAASLMPADAPNPMLVQDIGFFPFATEQPDKVFIIGPGAGLDVWFALQSGAREITAVEVNPASVDLVNEYRAYNGNLYKQPMVEVITDDGRSVLQRSDTQYDLIYLSQVVTLAAERGGYTLSENTVYTVEAFEEYLASLSDDGQIALKLYDEITLTRAVSIAMTALKNQGLNDQDALKHLLILLDPNAETPIPLLLVHKSPFTEDDALVLGAIARQIDFEPLYLPYVYVQSPLDAVEQGTATFDSIVESSESNISAPTDNQPYFFQFEYGIPATLHPLAVFILAISAVCLVLYALAWLRSSNVLVRAMPVYFAMLGLGFIAIEVYIIQETRLFLGHPTFAVTLVLATLLLGGGIGSGLSQRYLKSLLDRMPYLITALIVVLFILWRLVWGPLSMALLAQPLVVRGGVVAVLLLPLALCMGMPFPFGLRLVGESDNRLVAAAWAVNGVMSVVGSVLAVIISITGGYSAVSLLGLFAYGIATAMLFVVRKYVI
ncbi:hypothetical protein G4Y79_16705 [Phototrophicus methaneseepsis]|uniref:Spermidine synthase n=1 Tax=Phototrophicus methaneseepsis TaxID=2710758 RepID=A0A7S8IDG0_9CHLR|nr:hypothetical protein [Phototrophicus methaneseepsis]QPC81329.1 hypothetical protein G4Y79_16705 [Phototrophicus methaneseepsis]